MRFARVALGQSVILCGVDDQGALTTLNNAPGDPEDFLGLWKEAQGRGQSVLDVAAELSQGGQRLPWTLGDVDVAPTTTQPYLLMPYVPPEAWGAAFTYDWSGGSRHDAHLEERRAERPVVFFKATPHRCVGPNDAVGSRGDATSMIPEPELGLILARDGSVIGYTAVNDVSSRDMPAENPLYVCYSKTFRRCLSLGPTLVSAEAAIDPTSLDVRCRVLRDARVIWEEVGNTANMYRSYEELIHYLVRHNSIPLGTLLATGTALAPPQGLHIVEGDQVDVEIPPIGCLTNPVVSV